MSKFNTFTYGDKCSDEFNIVCDVETLSMLPNQKVYQMDIPALDGSVDFGVGGYDKRNLQLKLYYMDDYKNLRADREKIMAWLSSYKGQYKKLYLGTDTKYYKAKVISQFDFNITGNKEIGCVTFECNPPWQFDGEILQTPEQILWNNQDSLVGTQWLKKFTKSDVFRLTNTSNRKVKPLIKLFGSIQKGFLLSCGSQQLQIDKSFNCEEIIIDCESETIVNSDGDNLYSYVNLEKDDYFTLPSGKVEIGVSGQFGEYPNALTVIVEPTRNISGGMDNDTENKYESGGNG